MAEIHCPACPAVIECTFDGWKRSGQQLHKIYTLRYGTDFREYCPMHQRVLEAGGEWGPDDDCPEMVKAVKATLGV